MAIVGPVSIGGAFQRNALTLQIPIAAAVPAGAFVIVVVGTNAPDTANITLSDGTANSYFEQVQSQPPGAQAMLDVFLVQNALAVASGNITITSDTHADFAAEAYYFTGAYGELVYSNVEWFTTATTTPSMDTQALPNFMCFACDGIIGPSSDAFTNDPSWGPIVRSAVATATVTVRACSRPAVASGPNAYASYPWNPVLGTARRSIGFTCSFN